MNKSFCTIRTALRPVVLAYCIKSVTMMIAVLLEGCRVPDTRDIHLQYQIERDTWYNLQSVSIPTIRSGGTIIVRCKRPHRQGSTLTRLTCTDGTWDRILPKCSDSCRVPNTSDFRLEYQKENTTIWDSMFSDPFVVIPSGYTIIVRCNRKGHSATFGLTCTDGEWDRKLPKCSDPCRVPEARDTRLEYWDESKTTWYSKFSSSFSLIPSGYRLIVRCKREGPRVQESQSTWLTCTDGEWNRELPKCSGKCLVPETKDFLLEYRNEDTSTWYSMFSHSFVVIPSGDAINVRCNRKSHSATFWLTCTDGEWNSELPECSDQCRVPETRDVRFEYRNGEVDSPTWYPMFSSSSAIPSGDTIIVRCNRNGPHPIRTRLTCINGEWDRKLFRCSLSSDLLKNGACAIDKLKPHRLLNVPVLEQKIEQHFITRSFFPLENEKTVTLACSLGYAPVGRFQVTCINGVLHGLHTCIEVPGTCYYELAAWEKLQIYDEAVFDWNQVEEQLLVLPGQILHVRNMSKDEQFSVVCQDNLIQRFDDTRTCFWDNDDDHLMYSPGHVWNEPDLWLKARAGSPAAMHEEYIRITNGKAMSVFICCFGIMSEAELLEDGTLKENQCHSKLTE